MFKLITLFGLFLILAGISIVLRQLFEIDLPLGRIFFGVVLIWGGISVLARSSGHHVPGPIGEDDAVLFSSGTVEYGDRDELSVVFSSGVVDLTHVAAASPPRRIELNTVFGTTTVLYDEHTPIQVTASSAFGQVALPDASTVSFGERSWQSADFDPKQPGIVLKLSTVFGTTRFAARAIDAMEQSAVAGR